MVFTTTGLGGPELISSATEKGHGGEYLAGDGGASALKGSPEGSWPVSLEKFKTSANTGLQLEQVIEGYGRAIQYCCHYG